MQRRIGHRTTLAVPLLREGEAVGAIAVWRMEVRPFAAKQREVAQKLDHRHVPAIAEPPAERWMARVMKERLGRSGLLIYRLIGKRRHIISRDILRRLGA